MLDQSQEPVVWLHERAAEWAESHSDMERFSTNIHEGCHLLYARQVGFNPKCYGPRDDHYTPGIGWRRVLGGVEGPPFEVKFFADPIGVGCFYLGPRSVEYELHEALLRGLGEKDSGDSEKEIWEGCLNDLQKFNKWLQQLERITGDVYPELLLDVQRAVRADYRSPVFHQRVWECACEYERRVREQSKVA